jgi:tRNA 2-thiouridine synthesizing protein A
LQAKPHEPQHVEDDSLPLRELRRIFGGVCQDCRAGYTAHEAVWNIALGFKDSPRCFDCLCRRLGRNPDEFRVQLTGYVMRRECYLRAWREADRLENQLSSQEHQHESLPGPRAGPLPEGDVKVSGNVWDAGAMSCGELVMELRIRMNSLPSGTVFTIRATDPAAQEDIPAWCRLTGHLLVSAEHPMYRIRRREC